MNSKVYVQKCNSYQEVDKKLPLMIDKMGGMSSLVSEGDRIALKVNLLQPANPEKSITTNPAVVGSIGKLVREAGGKPFIIDSPGSGYSYNEKTLRKTYKASGLEKCAKENDIE